MTRLFALTLSLLLVSCISGPIDPDATETDPDGDADDERPEGPLHPDTFLVEEHPCFLSADPSDDNSVIDFEFACDASDVDELQVGKIVSGVEGGGYLRRIESLELAGHSATAWTSPATLIEALVDVDYSDHIEWGSREVIDFSGRSLDESTTEDGSTVRALIERGVLNIDPEMDIDAVIKWFSLKSVTAKLTVNLGYDVEALMEAGGAVSRSDTVDLETLQLPFETKVGPMNVRGKLDVTVRLAWEHTAEGPASDRFGFAGNGTVVMGGTYTKDGETWDRIWEPTYTGTLTEQIAGGSGDHHGVVTVQIEANLSMDKVDGSSFRYEPWNSGSTQADCTQLTYWSDAGLKGETTMRLGFFSDGPRVENYPDLAIEIPRVEGALVHDVPPAGCTTPIGDVPGECQPIADLTCGATFSGDTSSDPGATSNMDGYPCNVGNYNAPEMTWRFIAPYSGAMEVAFEGATPTEVNHDLLILDGRSGSCTSSECLAHGFNSVEFEATAGQAYFIVVDGFFEEAGGFVATVNCGL